MMRRIFGLLTVAAVMAVMMVVSAAPAFAAPGGPPIDVIHGQQVADFAKLPGDPYNPALPSDPYKGQQISLVARGLPLDTCAPQVVDTTCL